MSQVSTTSSVNATPGMVGDAMQLCHASVEENVQGVINMYSIDSLFRSLPHYLLWW